MSLQVGGTGLRLRTTLGRGFKRGKKWKGDDNRYMFFASRTQSPSGYPVDTTSLALTYFASKLKFGNAPYATREFWLHYSGFCMQEGLGPEETNLPGNDAVIDGVILTVDGIDYSGDFSGSAGTTITSGSKGAWCSFPSFLGDCTPDSDFIVTTKWHVGAVGQKFVANYRIQRHRGEKYWAAADGSALSALIAANGASTPVVDSERYYNIAPGNQTNSQLPCWGPDFMVAKGWDGRPVVLGTGDSIGYGRQAVSASADARGNMGWFHKFFDKDDPTYGRIPHYFIGNPSANSTRELNANSLKRWDILDDIKAMNGGDKYPFTIVVNQMGTNDANAVISTWKSNIVSLINKIRTRLGAGTKIIQCTIPPQNNPLTAGNLGFTADGFSIKASTWTTGLDSINSDIRNNAGFNHNGYIDVNTAWVDPANPDRFMNAQGMGQVGTLISSIPGDGTSTHPTAVISWEPDYGEGLLIEYTANTYAARQIIDFSPVGDGTYNATFTNTYTTVVQSDAKAWRGISNEGIHPWDSYVDYWVLPRLSQSNKALLNQ
jgi:hypothetical protein